MLNRSLWSISIVLLWTALAYSQISFADATAGAPLADSGLGTAVVWCDYDKDGDMDIYVCNQDGANKLFQNVDGTSFIDAGAVDPKVAPLLDTGVSNGAAWADINNDGDLDMYIANQDQPNKLIERQGGGVYADITAAPLDDDSNRSRGGRNTI